MFIPTLKSREWSINFCSSLIQWNNSETQATSDRVVIFLILRVGVDMTRKWMIIIGGFVNASFSQVAKTQSTLKVTTRLHMCLYMHVLMY